MSTTVRFKHPIEGVCGQFTQKTRTGSRVVIEHARLYTRASYTQSPTKLTHTKRRIRKSLLSCCAQKSRGGGHGGLRRRQQRVEDFDGERHLGDERSGTGLGARDCLHRFADAVKRDGVGDRVYVVRETLRAGACEVGALRRNLRRRLSQRETKEKGKCVCVSRRSPRPSLACRRLNPTRGVALCEERKTRSTHARESATSPGKTLDAARSTLVAEELRKAPEEGRRPVEPGLGAVREVPHAVQRARSRGGARGLRATLELTRQANNGRITRECDRTPLSLSPQKAQRKHKPIS